MEKQSVEILKQIKSNTQIRYQQDDNVIIVSVHGPYQTGSSKASQQAIFDIQVKVEQDKSVEQQLKQVFEQAINLHEYPQQLIRVSCIIQINTINIFSSLCNGIMIALIHQGISMKQSLYSVTLDNTKYILELITQNIVFVDGKTKHTKECITKHFTEASNRSEQFGQWLKSYLYEYYASNNIL